MSLQIAGFAKDTEVKLRKAENLIETWQVAYFQMKAVNEVNKEKYDDCEEDRVRLRKELSEKAKELDIAEKKNRFFSWSNIKTMAVGGIVGYGLGTIGSWGPFLIDVLSSAIVPK